MLKLPSLETIIIALLLVIVIAVGLHSGRQALEIAELKSDNSQLQAKLTISETARKTAIQANADLVVSLEEVNSKVTDWKKQADDAYANALAEVKAAREAQAQWRKKYLAVLSSPPEYPDDQYRSLELRINQYIALRASP